MADKAGWISTGALGVAIVVAGNYVAWNYGIAAGGWAGMVGAVALSAVLYFALATCMAELSTMYQSEAGAVEFVRRAFGQELGAAVGWCVVCEFIGAGAALAGFFGAYAHALSGWPAGPMMAALVIVALTLQSFGARDALWVSGCMTAVAVAGISLTVVFLGATTGERPFHSFWPDAIAAQHGSWIGGIWEAIPYAVVLFLGLEGIALTVEQVAHPARTIPRALLGALGTQCLLVFALLLITPSTVDLSALMRVDDPIAFAWHSMGTEGIRGMLAKACTGCALLATATSFFSVMFAYSRQWYALSREGFLPSIFKRRNGCEVPVIALTVPSAAVLLLAISCPPELLVVLCVFGATASYLLIFAAHLKLRQSAAEHPRAYRAPGLWVPLVGMLFTAIAVLACLGHHGLAVTGAILAIGLLTGYSISYSNRSGAARAGADCTPLNMH